MHVPEVPTEILLRPGTTDQDAFTQVFLDREYDIPLETPDVIVDAGANTGLASLWFSNRYPEARILAIEPDQSNFYLLKRNTLAYDNIETLRAGLWSHKTNLAIKNPEADPWAFRVTESEGPSDISAIGIDDIMKRMDIDILDMLKLDIEGAEKEVFSNSRSWIGKVNTIIIETHDRFRPGCTEALEKAIESQAFQKTHSGENIVLTRHPMRWVP